MTTKGPNWHGSKKDYKAAVAARRKAYLESKQQKVEVKAT